MLRYGDMSSLSLTMKGIFHLYHWLQEKLVSALRMSWTMEIFYKSWNHPEHCFFVLFFQLNNYNIFYFKHFCSCISLSFFLSLFPFGVVHKFTSSFIVAFGSYLENTLPNPHCSLTEIKSHTPGKDSPLSSIIFSSAKNFIKSVLPHSLQTWKVISELKAAI